MRHWNYTVESKFEGIPAVGFEANKFAQFASKVKVNWNIDSIALLENAHIIRSRALTKLAKLGLTDSDDNILFDSSKFKRLNHEKQSILLTNSISDLPLHKALVLIEEIDRFKGEDTYRPLLLALANTVVFRSSNLRFGPEVGVGKIKMDAQVVEPWFEQVSMMSRDLLAVAGHPFPNAELIPIDAREINGYLKKKSIDAIITSPPYPNEKDYSRTTRLESVLLGLVNSKDELRAMKKTLLRSNTRGVYKGDDDDKYVESIPEVQQIAADIEKKRKELGKTSGFEKMYARVTKLYFGGMAKHLLDLQPYLKTGAHLAYVVGDQASYLQIMIRTGRVIGDIAKSLGYELEGIEPFRTRFSTATKTNLNEEVVVLRWTGKKRK